MNRFYFYRADRRREPLRQLVAVRYSGEGFHEQAPVPRIRNLRTPEIPVLLLVKLEVLHRALLESSEERFAPGAIRMGALALDFLVYAVTSDSSAACLTFRRTIALTMRFTTVL